MTPLLRLRSLLNAVAALFLLEVDDLAFDWAVSDPLIKALEVGSLRTHRHDALALRAVKDSTVFGAFVVVLLLPLAVRIFPKSTGAFGGFILAGGAIFFVLCSVQTTLVLEIYLWKKHYRGESARSKAASAARWVVAIIMGLLPALMF